MFFTQSLILNDFSTNFICIYTNTCIYIYPFISAPRCLPINPILSMEHSVQHVVFGWLLSFSIILSKFQVCILCFNTFFYGQITFQCMDIPFCIGLASLYIQFYILTKFLYNWRSFQFQYFACGQAVFTLLFVEKTDFLNCFKFILKIN